MDRDQRIEYILRQMDFYTLRRFQCIQALSDDTLASAYPTVLRARPETRFADGASTQQILRYVKQRFEDGESTIDFGPTGAKLDREARDQHLVPLIPRGILQRACWVGAGSGKKKRYTRVDRHVSKNQNNCYRLSDEFRSLLELPDAQFPAGVRRWIASEPLRRQQAVQAEAARAQRGGRSSHSDLIHSAVAHFLGNRFAGYALIFVDDDDGNRIRDEWRDKLEEAGIELTLDDRFPDAILWSRERDDFLILDAVTSDGEVDEIRMSDIQESFARQGKRVRHFATAYATWKRVAERQAQVKNLARGSLLWIAEDGGKYLEVNSVVTTEGGA